MDNRSVSLAVLITARGGSKGIPGKNLKSFAGKPLIAWSVEAALGSGVADRVLVSTDSAEIAGVARGFGAEVPFLRPARLAADDTPHLAVLLHALDWLEAEGGVVPDYLMLLQPTSPLRSAADVRAAFKLAVANNADAVVSVSAAVDHPALCKRIGEGGELISFITSESGKYLRRQDLPPAFVINGAVYLFRPAVLRETRSTCPPGALAYVMPPERSPDLDTEFDWRVAEFIHKNTEGVG